MVSKKGKEAAGKGKDVIGKDTGKGKSEKVAGKGKEVVGKVTRKGQKVTGKGKEVPGKSKRVIGKSKTVAGKDTEKGKEVPGKVTGKRKCAADTDEAGGRKKRNRGVVQFFEDEVYNGVDDDDDDLSDYGGHWDFFEDVFEAQSSGVKNDSGKPRSVPFFFEEEELSDGEMEEMVEECYRVGSNFITYANDTANTGISVDGNENLSPFKEPIVWKVKCKIGSEKQSVFCLMQKYVEFNSLGNKLQIISAFSPDHVKGFIYIEAEKQADIYEACKGICTIFSNQVAHIPKDDVSRTFSIQSKRNEVSIGLFGRVKNGRYKGDLAQIIFVNDFRKKATVKLIPRIDLQVLAEKYGGGVRSKKSGVPPPRFITSTELEEFRPLIQCRRDRECGLAFEILDGMMFKDGYLYKKVSIDSLNLYGVTPSEDELFKFESFKNEISDCEEWLTDLYDEKNKEPSFINCEKGNDGKGEGSSSSSIETNFEVGDFVLFNWADFGVIVGSEKDENYMILKESPEGPMVVMIDVPQLKKALFGNRFTALDNREKIIFINDTVRVLEGPLEGRQGNVKHIYRGIVFLHDEVEQENNGYFCCKSLSCEKINFSDDASKGKVSDAVFSTFNDPPLSPLARTKGRDNRFNKENKEGINVGQSLRIRVGPLKGYLCRILAIHRTDITVKLDSQQKTLSVKYEHLAGAHGRSSAIPLSDDKDAKPIYPLGKPEGSVECMSGARTSAAVGKRSSWPAFPSSGTQPKSNSPMETDNKGGSCVTKLASKPSSTWGIPPVGKKPAFINEQAGDNWGKGGNNWSNKPNLPGTYQGNPNTSKSNTAPSPWGKSNTEKKDSARAWGRKTVKSPGGGQCGSWGKNNPEIFYSGPAWGKSKTVEGRAGKDAEDDIMGKCSKPWGNKKEFIGKKVGWKSYGQGEDSQGGGWDRTKCFNGVGGGVRNWGRGGLRGRGGGGRERGGRVGGGRLGRGGRGDGNRGSFQGRGRSGRGGIGFGGRGGGNGDWGNNQNGGGGGFGGRGGNGDWGTNKNGGGGGGRGRGSGGGFGGRGGGRRGGNGDWGTNKNGGDGVGRGDGGGGSVRGGCDGGFGGRDKNSDRENNQNGGGGSASRGGGGGRSGSGGGDSGGHGRADAGGWSKENNDGGSKGGW